MAADLLKLVSHGVVLVNHWLMLMMGNLFMIAWPLLKAFSRFGDSLEFISLLYMFVVGKVTKLLNPLFRCKKFLGPKMMIA